MVAACHHVKAKKARIVVLTEKNSKILRTNESRVAKNENKNMINEKIIHQLSPTVSKQVEQKLRINYTVNKDADTKNCAENDNKQLKKMDEYLKKVSWENLTR